MSVTKSIKLSPGKYELIILDCDGTLVDSEPISNQVVADMMTEKGVPMTREQSVRLFAGRKFADIEAYLREHSGSESLVGFEDNFRARSKEAFAMHLKPIEGVEHFIRTLGELDYPFCVASNGPRKKMSVTLDVAGLKKYFPDSRIFSAYDIRKWKPDPELFLHAAEQFNCDPSKVLVLEDTASGFEAAQRAHMDCLIYRKEDETADFVPQEMTFTKWSELTTLFKSHS